MLIKVLINFLVGILIGFVFEFIYRSIESQKIIMPKLVNVQMYGLIGAFLVFVYYLNLRFPYKLIIFFIIPTCLEFLTGYLYLKIKKIYLWNYDAQKYNFMGLVCPLFSTFWFIISLVYYFTVLPLILNNL